MKKSVIRIVCFLLLLVGVLYETNNIFKFKYGDGIYGLTTFYEQDRNSIDVLILGSSHAFEDFNTGVLWDEYGIASFILGGSEQPMWNSYYYLKEALKTQSPELIVLEGYMTSYDEDYVIDSRIIKNNYGLRWSQDKVASLRVSAPEERWDEFILEYAQYHTRYDELSSEDFLSNQGNPLYENWKGFGCNMFTMEYENKDITGVTSRTELHKKTEEYYRKIIMLAQEKSIPIVIIVSPYASVSEGEQAIYNQAQDIAEEYGVEFINYNTMYCDIGIDFATDVADSDHLNYRGNQKFSLAVGQYLVNHYDVSDRRGDERYQSWQRDAEYIKAMILNQELTEIQDSKVFVKNLQNKSYLLLVSFENEVNRENADMAAILNAIHISSEDAVGIICIDANEIMWSSGSVANEKYIMSGIHDIGLQRKMDELNGDYVNIVMIDNMEYKKVDAGINITVYNTLTQSMVDSVGINVDNMNTLIR